MRFLGLTLVVAALLHPAGAEASICDSPSPEWLMCEDFEGADAGWESWFSSSGFVECRGCADGVNDPDRLYLSEDSDHVFDGRYAMHMPAAAASGYQGGELIFRDCVGEGRQGCDLRNHERLYLRTRVKLAADHQYVHHFLSIGGTRPTAYWEGSGNAGCRPNGYRHAGTTVDFNQERGLFFYTYFPEMNCDSGGYCSGGYVQDICNGCAEKDMPCSAGPECCWGNLFRSPERVELPRGEWACLEMMMQINSPGASDGEMAFWIDDALAHRETGMNWRDVSELGLNRANMSHYIARGDADRPNRVSFDDFIVSTARIGCDMTPEPPVPMPDAGTSPGADSGAATPDGGVAPSGPGDDAGDDAGGGSGSGGGSGDGGGGTMTGGCSATPMARAPSAWLFVVAALLMGLRRRRSA